MKNLRKTFRVFVFLMAVSLTQLAGAANDVWTGLGSDQTWANSANWSAGTPPPGGIVVFPAAMYPASTNAPGVTNNIVGVNTTIGQLWYINTNGVVGSSSNAYDTTLISPYVTLAVTNSLYVGPNNGANATTVAAMLGTNCALIVTNLTGTFGVGYTNTANVQTVTFTLPDGTNYIQVGTFAVGNSDGGNGRQSILNLGNGTNVILAPYIELGWSKAQGRVQFVGPNGGLLMANTNGGRANITVGRGSSGTASANGQLALTNYANILASTVTNGWGAASSTAGSPQGTITIQSGIFDATTLVIGANTGGTQSASGTFNLGGAVVGMATMIINSPAGPGGGQFLLSDANNTTQTGVGTFNINTNGIAEIYCSINKYQQSYNTATINLNGGTLILESATDVIGSTTPIDSLNLNGGTLQVSVNGNNSTTANIIANAVTTSTDNGMNVINIGSVTNVLIPEVIHLINYGSGGDPGLANFQLGTYPVGYNATLQDDGSQYINLYIGANIPIVPVLWVGAVGSTLNSNWNFTVQDWQNLTNGAPTLYANPDLTAFDDSASNSTVVLATNFTPGALAFSNSVLSYLLEGPGSIGGSVGVQMDGNSTVTLAESGGDSFSGGVTVNSGTVVLDDANSTVSGSVEIASGSTLQIGNNDSHGSLPSGGALLNGTLILDQTSSGAISGPITGYGALTLNGSGKVTLTSAANNYSGNTTINAGTLALAGSGTISNSANVSVSSGALDVSGESGVTLLNTLALANASVVVTASNSAYLQSPINLVNSGLSLGGSGNTISVTAVPTIAAYPSSLTLIQSSSGMSGTFNMTLGTLPSGYSGYVTNEGNDVVLVLTNGPTGVRPYVAWSGVDAMGDLSTNWTDAMNWELPGVPSSTDTIIFDTAGQQTGSAYSSPGGGVANLVPSYINNIVNTNFTVSTLIFTNIGSSGSPSFQNTYITNGMTLLVTNSLSIGSSSADYGSSAQENVTVSGPSGTLTVTNPSSTFIVNLIDANNSGEQAILDMSGLENFNATVSLFEVGAVVSTADDVSGVAYLAETNTIIATGGNNGINEAGQDETLSLLVGETGKGASTEAYLYLGQQNVIHAYTIGVGIAKDVGEMEFNPTFTGDPSAPPTVSIIGGDGVSPVQAWAIGDALAQSGSSTSPAGTADFSGGIVNAQVSLMYLGRSANVSGAKSSQGTLTFGEGTIAAGTIYDGFEPYNDTDYGNGTINVNGTGQLNVGTLNLAWTSGTLASPTLGNLNITGGTVLAGTIAADTNNFGQSAVTLNGGLLAITNALGSSAAPLYSLTLNGGTLQLSPNAASTNVVATSVSIGSPITINIASITTTVGGAQQIPIISYLNGSDPTLANVTLGTIPFGYTGASLVDDGVSQIYLSITAPASLVWAGALSGGSLDGNWNIADQNWLNGATYVAYADPDFVQFTDAASTNVVTLAATVSPDTIVVANNSLNYVFNGSHAIAGTGTLTKSGTASLTLADTGGDSFSGGLIVNGGAVILDDAGSTIGGSVAINSGSVQLGNNDANGNLPGNITDNGSLILDRSNPLTMANTLSGSGNVTQINTNTVTLTGANSGFTGKLTITNGILNTTLPSGLGAATATTVVTNGGTFDDNGIAFNNIGAPALIVSGAGYNGLGAIVNNGPQQTAAFSNIVVAGNVTIGGPDRWDLRDGSGTAAWLTMSPAGSPYSITKVGTNEIALVNVGNIDAGLGNIYVQQGELGLQLGTAQLGNPASNLVVSAGALLEMYGVATPLNKVITFYGNGTSDTFKSDNSTNNQNIVIGPVTLNGECVFDVSTGVYATFGGVIGGTGALTKITSGSLTLTNVNTYTGNTAVNAGVLALTGSGAVGSSSNIIVAAGAALSASGRINQTLTLNSSQTLSGFGTVTGLVVAASGSIIAPGSTNSTGTLTFSTNVTLTGTALMKVSAVSVPTNDVLNVSGTLALGGALNVTSLGGTYLAGDSFKLFTAGSGITGSFSATNLPALTGGLGWVTTNLINGIISVANAVNTNPTNIVATVSGNTLTLAWPGDHIGWRLQVETNSAGSGLNPNPGAWYTVPGSTSVDTESFTVDPSQGNVFYRLVYP